MQEKIFKFNYTNILDDNFTAHIFSAWHHLAWGEQALSCASNITPTEESFEIGIKCICNYQEGTSTSLFVRKGDLMKIMKVHLPATYSWCICTVLYVRKWVVVVFLLMRYNICLQKSNCCYWKFTTNISLLAYNNRISCPIHKWPFY